MARVEGSDGSHGYRRAMRRRAPLIGIFSLCVLLTACGGDGFSKRDAAALIEAQHPQDAAVCEHRSEDPSSIFRCRVHRKGEPSAAIKISADGSETIKVESCAAVRFVEHPPRGYIPPCIGTGLGIPYDGLIRAAG